MNYPSGASSLSSGVPPTSNTWRSQPRFAYDPLVGLPPQSTVQGLSSHRGSNLSVPVHYGHTFVRDHSSGPSGLSHSSHSSLFSPNPEQGAPDTGSLRVDKTHYRPPSIASMSDDDDEDGMVLIPKDKTEDRAANVAKTVSWDDDSCSGTNKPTVGSNQTESNANAATERSGTQWVADFGILKNGVGDGSAVLSEPTKRSEGATQKTSQDIATELRSLQLENAYLKSQFAQQRRYFESAMSNFDVVQKAYKGEHRNHQDSRERSHYYEFLTDVMETRIYELSKRLKIRSDETDGRSGRAHDSYGSGMIRLTNAEDLLHTSHSGSTFPTLQLGSFNNALAKPMTMFRVSDERAGIPT